MSSHQTGFIQKSSDVLPKVFVDSMRTLFDILDDKSTGYVHIKDIEEFWCDSEDMDMPVGMVDCLHKVAPSSGLLSFDRFVAGLRICLLRNRAVSSSQTRTTSPILSSVSSSGGGNGGAPTDDLSTRTGDKNAPIGGVNSQLQRLKVESDLSCRADHQFVNSAPELHQRAASLSQLHSFDGGSCGADMEDGRLTQPPPKPPRQPPLSQPTRVQVLSALQKWHRQRACGTTPHQPSTENSGVAPLTVNCGDCGDVVTVSEWRAVGTSAVSSRRSDPRRHTLQNGVDHNMYRRVRQLEQERLVLQRGLQAVEAARHWYTHNLSQLRQQTSLACLGRLVSHSERSTDANQERLAFLTARVHEVSQHLAALVDSSSGRFPLHINLALATTSSSHHPSSSSSSSVDTCRKLTEHNQQLSKELVVRNERIVCLEREKASLIRQLFNARSELSTVSNSDGHGTRSDVINSHLYDDDSNTLM